MKTPFFVSTRCPECGGSVRHLEGAYTFACPFCASALRTESEGVTLKYIIPLRLGRTEVLDTFNDFMEKEKGERSAGLREVSRIECVYKPFWYCKGMVYSCRSSGAKNDLDARIWSHTFEANTLFATSLPTLGLRSEVLTIEAYDSDRFEKEGVILPVLMSMDEAHQEALDLASGVGTPAGPSEYHKTIVIGEKMFLIYYPVVMVSYREGGSVERVLFDGVNRGPLGKHRGDRALDVESSGEKAEPYHLKIVTHRCKNCGYDLEASDFDIIFNCKNCSRLWLLKGNDYHPQKITFLKAADEKNTIYIPFWRFEVRVSSKSAGINMRTIGDLATFMKMGRHILRDEDGDRPMRFYIPAVVTRNAKAAIKLAGRIGTFQKELPVDHVSALPDQRIWNVSLGAEEAEEMLRPLIFLVVGRIDRLARKFYNDHEIAVIERRLVGYPFEEKGKYLVDRFHNYNFHKRSMDVNVY